MNWLITVFEPFTFDFMYQALIIALLVSISASVLSCLLVLKGWSLMGDAVSHAVLPGIVIAYVLSIPMIIGAFITGMVCAVSTGYFTENSRLKEDTVMGVVFSGLFALGIVLFTKINTDLHLHEVLFGDMLGVSWSDILLTACLTIPAFLLIVIKRRDLLVFAFDPQHAKVVGLNTKFLHYGLLCILSLVIVASIKAVGIILVISVLIAPGAISYLLTNRFEHMMWWSVLIATVSTVLGLTLSYHIDSAPAPTIVVLLSIIFIIVFLFAPQRGLLRKTKDFGE
ncbi:metal ABC transporter permease [Granulosicoccus sp.]|nr:metal ABC transporter permease [Granulosicoccus sp.]MDB4223515.1 metal ABC transporter permease [Granulosicoccus sp.]